MHQFLNLNKSTLYQTHTPPPPRPARSKCSVGFEPSEEQKDVKCKEGLR
jgi:hypothetical protein